MQNLNKKEFQKQVLESKGLVVALFWATWCSPCRAILPIFEQISREQTEAKFVQVNIDEEKDLVARYEISRIPIILFFNNGSRVDSIVGLIPKGKIEELIKKNL